MADELDQEWVVLTGGWDREWAFVQKSSAMLKQLEESYPGSLITLFWCRQGQDDPKLMGVSVQMAPDVDESLCFQTSSIPPGWGRR